MADFSLPPATGDTSLETPCPIASLVPHARGMCLLETLEAAHATHAVATALPRVDDLFAEPAGIPAWVGIEWMAQAVAAWAGFQARARREPPPPGMLLGSRRYRCEVPCFPVGRPVRVSVRIDFVADNGVTQVEGELHADDGELLASGTLTLYRPASSAPDPSTRSASSGTSTATDRSADMHRSADIQRSADPEDS